MSNIERMDFSESIMVPIDCWVVMVGGVVGFGGGECFGPCSLWFDSVCEGLRVGNVDC